MRLEEFMRAIKCSKETIIQLLEDYYNEQIAKGNNINTEKEFRIHFVNWSKIQMKNEERYKLKNTRTSKYRNLD